MPRSTLAPGFIRLYSTTVISAVAANHTQELGIAAPAWSGLTTTITKKDGGTGIWSVELAAFIVLWKALHQAATTFTTAEIWKQTLPTDDPILQATVTLNVVGTAAGSAQSACQSVFAFRGADDSGMRLTALEGVRAHNARVAYAGLTAAEKAVVDYVIGSGTWLYTRGNSFPVGFTMMTSKINDKLRKQRLNL